MSRLCEQTRAPERRCIATGETGAPDRFVRFVRNPQGWVMPDFAGKLPGRGAWVTANREALAAAVKKRAFARSFGGDAKAPEDLAAIVEAGLVKAALSALGMARRVGKAAVGFDQAARLCRAGKAVVLVSAAGGGEDGQRKLKALAPAAPFFGFFEGRELSAALGREGVVHVALKSGAAAKRFAREARRLEGFRASVSQPREERIRVPVDPAA